MEGVDGKKGLRVNGEKTKVIWCQVSEGHVNDSGEYPCSVCRKGVGNNSIFYVKCVGWVHKRCSGISGRLTSNVDSHGRRCLEGKIMSYQFC